MCLYLYFPSSQANTQVPFLAQYTSTNQSPPPPSPLYAAVNRRRVTQSPSSPQRHDAMHAARTGFVRSFLVGARAAFRLSCQEKLVSQSASDRHTLPKRAMQARALPGLPLVQGMFTRQGLPCKRRDFQGHRIRVHIVGSKTASIAPTAGHPAESQATRPPSVAGRVFGVSDRQPALPTTY